MIRTEVSSPDLMDLAVALKYEQNGAVMRRDMVRALRAAIKPAVAEAKTSIMSMESSGLKRNRAFATAHGVSLRAAIAKQITTEVSATQRSAKVKVKVRRRGMPRNFKNAPKAVSLPQGWRHPVIGTNGQRWVEQIGKPGWFDQPLRSHRQQYRAAVKAAVDATAVRIAGKV